MGELKHVVSTHRVGFQTRCVVFQYDHQHVSQPQEIPLGGVLHISGAENVGKNVISVLSLR